MSAHKKLALLDIPCVLQAAQEGLEVTRTTDKDGHFTGVRGVFSYDRIDDGVERRIRRIQSQGGIALPIGRIEKRQARSGAPGMTLF